ncbi:hypothetical protein BC939DRAFT_434628 [Gamsiella multidivaricata]|uniref:uncharacterized protein n=1 Tax=Gamsiella multidivaricata TaxID=101098 RepID=UPI002220E77C|nr:uncharacterized protein BC939DRAFT_434628 [Gamsiella multidivaricata]KAI7832856.1 hypothetical protein BC939DRAFT_434628 [Gamsiella multidivaricata]
MKQYVWKPFKEPEPKTEKPKPKQKQKPAPKSLSTLTAETYKLKITRMLAYQHPATSLHIGTLSANIEQALPSQNSLQHEVKSVLLDAAKRLVEKGLEGLDAQDRTFLDLICPRVTMKDVENNADDAVEEDEDGNQIAGIEVVKFIKRLEELHLYNPPRTRAEINERMPFTPTDLVRSVVGQLKAGLKRMYKTGTCDLHKMVRLEVACHQYRCSLALERV